ncbi:MAG: aminotransferase class III-fold pyridoxal phosphate-dependent enzyme [Actinomycetota bacterium]
MTDVAPSDLDQRLAHAHKRFSERRPKSRAAHEAALAHLPGGNTRSVLHYRPFPYRVASASGAVQTDLDGYTYVDFCGNYTAALFGQSEPVVRNAIIAALDDGWAIGAVREQEAQLAGLLCERFPSLDQVRFTNSGTEANLMAIGTAGHHTGRDGVLVFDRGYHGGVLSFGGAGVAGSPLNAPYAITVAPFDDPEAAVAHIDTGSFGCVLVEPIQGSGGCRVPGPAFLPAIRDACDRSGTVLIFDEVMTSRLSAAGAQGRLGVTPDMTTLGKYFGGGMSFGAFGGSRAIMRHFDGYEGGALTQAGTFNNNAASMAAAVTVISKLLTPERLEDVNARGDRLRSRLGETFAAHGTPMTCTGMGSMLCIHADEPRLLELLFLALVEQGLFIAPRGFMALSTAITDDHVDALVEAVAAWTDALSDSPA